MLKLDFSGMLCLPENKQCLLKNKYKTKPKKKYTLYRSREEQIIMAHKNTNEKRKLNREKEKQEQQNALRY